MIRNNFPENHLMTSPKARVFLKNYHQLGNAKKGHHSIVGNIAISLWVIAKVDVQYRLKNQNFPSVTEIIVYKYTKKEIIISSFT
ncbi:hypothetical protein CCAN12_720013 [Capnocytophaga canimorsus]|uniref:Uncharacterized protein n=1 Tax=Capnocytophaga canimorsus TaxID=28188 RepID=A0A0B7HFE9_9FLAO|nr:hypothetical protein CCAN12_720013 [Capnocytophaga canimorsus]